MWFRSWFDSLLSNSARTPAAPARRRARRQRAATRRLVLEPLEVRCLLSLAPPVNYAVGAIPQAVVTADLTGDGRLDLATANSSGNSVSVLRGNADGTFGAASDFAAGANPRSVAVGDFNGDGKLDLVTANNGGNDVSVLLGTGGGTFGAPRSVPLQIPAIPANVDPPLSVAVGDFNKDGKLDLAVSSEYSFYMGGSPGGCGPYGCYGGTPGFWVTNGYVTVVMGNGDGTFGTQNTTQLAAGSPVAVAVANLNGDGNPDIVTANYDNGTVSVLLGNGLGGIGSVANFSVGYGSYSVAAGDVNGDGKPDLVTANLDGNSVSVLLGDGLGGFGASQNYTAVSLPSAVALSDVNGDGKPDVVTADWTGAVSVLLGTGTGAFRPPVNVGGGAGATGVAVGDFNGDGRPDAASANDYSSNTVSVLLNDGSWPALDAPVITIDSRTVTEGNTGTTDAVFTVTLSAAGSQSITVRYATVAFSATAGSDFQATTGTLTFAPGQTTRTIAVPINGDHVAESTESFAVNLSDPTNAFVADGQGLGNITDDEPFIAISNLAAAEGNTGTTVFNFTVTLSAAYDAPVTVDYATADLDYWYEWYGMIGATAGVDYQATSGTLTFVPGETTKAIPVSVSGDRLGEGDEYFLLNLSNPTGAALVANQALGTIMDDEPYVFIDSTSGSEGNVGTTPFTFTVTLSAASDLPVTVDYTTAPGSATAGVDYQATSGTLTFVAGQTSMALPVLVNGDRAGEYHEDFYVNLTGVDGALLSYTYGYGTILDDEPHVAIGNAAGVEGNTGTKAFTFPVSLSPAYDAPVTVNYATRDGNATAAGGDYRATSGTLTFATGQTSKTITVLVNGDSLGESDEYFYVSATGAMTLEASGYATIQDDEPRIRINSVSMKEGNSGTTLFVFSVTLSAASSQTVTVNFATQDYSATAGGDYTATSGQLTFAPGQTSKTITVVVKGDKKKEADEYFQVVLGSASSNALLEEAYGWGTIRDDDGRGR